MSVFKTIEKVLRKSEMYINVPESILNAKKGEKVRFQHSQLGGVIPPKDLERMIANGNEEVLGSIVHNAEKLTYDDLKKISRTGIDDNTVYALASRMNKTSPKAAEDIMSNESPDVVKKFLKFATNPEFLTGPALFAALSRKSELDDDALFALAGAENFDKGHLDELYKTASPRVLITALRNVGYQDADSIKPHLNFLMKHGSVEAKKAIMNDVINNPRSNPVERAFGHVHAANALQSGDEELQAMALEIAPSAPHVEYVLDHVIQNAKNPEKLLGIISRKSTRYFPEGLNDRLVLSIAEKAPELLTSLEERKISEDAAKKLYQSQDPRVQNLIPSFVKPGYSDETYSHLLGSTNPYTHAALLRATKNHDIQEASFQKLSEWPPADDMYTLSIVMNRVFANPDLKPELFTKLKTYMGKHLTKHNIYSAVKNPNVPEDFIKDILSSPDPDIRVHASLLANPTPEIMKVGLKDPDKGVRNNWIIAHGSKMPPDVLDIALRDRAPTNRLSALKVGVENISPESLHRILTKDKSEDMRSLAANNFKTPPEALAFAAQQDPSDEVKRRALVNINTPDSVVDDYVKNMKKSDLFGDYNSSFISGLIKKNLSPEAIMNYHSLMPKNSYRAHEAALKYPDDTLIKTHSSLSEVKNLIDLDKRFHDGKRLSSEYIDNIISKADALDDDTASGLDFKQELISLSTHKNISQDTVNKMLRSNKKDLKKTAYMGSNDLGLLKRAAASEDKDIVDAITLNNNLNEDVINGLLENNNLPLDRIARLFDRAERGGFIKNLIPAFYKKAKSTRHRGIKLRIATHKDTPESLLHEMSNDENREVSVTAARELSHHNPNSYNELVGGHEISIHPHVEKLKHLKGKLDEAGGVVHKNDLPNKGQGIDGPLFDGRGLLTSNNVDRHAENLPKTKFNVSWSEWDGAQKHDEDSPPQKVLQLNMTNDHIKKIKEEGLWDTFKKIHEMSHSSGHPVRYHTLGWARIDDSHPDHWHIDEIQSDIGQGTIRQIENAKSSGQMAPEEANKYTEAMKKMINIFSGPFKNINHAIFGAVHQAAREKGVKSTSMDKLEDQAKQSGMDTGVELPGHMKHTYDQMPKSYGYTEAPKKDVMPDTEAPESHVQVRKLTKSMVRLKQLLENLTQ